MLFLYWAQSYGNFCRYANENRFLGDFFVKGVGYGGQAAVESLREVECAMRRLCAFGGCGGKQQS
jgi:hypothetical protein